MGAARDLAIEPHHLATSLRARDDAVLRAGLLAARGLTRLDPPAALLMLLAGLLHATWHAMVKTGNGLAILAGMGLVSAMLTLPWLFVVPMPSEIGRAWCRVR